MTVAFLRFNVVINVALVDSLEHAHALWPAADVREISGPVGIGWSYDADTDTFTPPVEPDAPEPEPVP